MRVKLPDGPYGDKSLSYLCDRSMMIQNLILRQKTVTWVLSNSKFHICPGGKSRHHTYEGGLVKHTAEVLECALKMAESSFLEVNKDILIAACIWHDFGKIYDYNCNAEGWDNTTHRFKVRHLSKSHALFCKAFVGFETENWFEEIEHCILSHHGRHEWGSPVLPQTAEAHILHMSDMMSMLSATGWNGAKE